MRTQRQVCCAKLLLLTLFFMAFLPSVAARDVNGGNDTTLVTQTLQQLNAWRVKEGLAPLQVNTTLQQMALDQALYLQELWATGRNVSDLHADAQGRNPRQRAQQKYAWPTYNAPEQIEVGEIAAVGSLPFAFKFWDKSPIHHATALNSTYQEVGAAVVPNRNGDNLFIVVFGTRPHNVTIQISPDRRTLYMAQDQSRYNATAGNAPTVRLFNAAGQPLTANLAWSSSLPIPQVDDTTLYVLLTDGEQQMLYPLQVPAALALLANVSVAVADLAPTPIGNLPPTSTPVATTPTEPAASATAIPTTLKDADIIISYTADDLVIRAVATSNLSQLNIRTNNKLISISLWQNVAPFPAANFPKGACLVIRRSAADSITPQGCESVRAVVIFGNSRLFWTQMPFDVLNGKRVVATCQPSASDGQCLLKMD